MNIFCCQCQTEVDAVLIFGTKAYPHRSDLKDLPLWECPTCKNFVGCHHKTKDRAKPLGVIPNKEIKSARQHIHAILDPLWKEKKVHRKQIYAYLSDRLGYEYHTAEIKSVEDGRKVYRLIKNFIVENNF